MLLIITFKKIVNSLSIVVNLSVPLSNLSTVLKLYLDFGINTYQYQTFLPKFSQSKEFYNKKYTEKDGEFFKKLQI